MEKSNIQKISVIRRPLNISELNNNISDKTKICNNKRQQTPKTNPLMAKIQNKQGETLIEKIKNFAGLHGNIYVVFGGVGDLVLVLAECYKDKTAKVIFFANSTAAEFGKYFLNFFQVNSMIHPNVMGSKIANQVVAYLKDTGRLQPSAHLADNLYYGDWYLNTEKYKNRMKRYANWVEDVGFIEEYKNKKTLILGPSGSFRAYQKQKFLSNEEYVAIVNHYLKNNYTVISTGADKDYSFYSKINHENHLWIMANKMVLKNGIEIPLKFNEFIKIINSATEVISVDTWLKTYTSLAGLPTKVIPNRSSNEWMPFGADPSDYIFINEDFWPSMKLVKPEEIIQT